MTSELSHHDLYEAALDDALFSTLPERLARQIDVPSAMFFWMHPDDFLEISAGTQPEADPHYDAFIAEDPWMAHATDDKIGHGAFRLTDYVAPDAFEKSAMYNEFIVENRLERFWCVGLLQSTRDGKVVTAFHKGRRAGDFTDAQMQTIHRHTDDLGRLHAIRRELHRASIRRITGPDRGLLDDAPVFELDHEGRLLRLNGKAERLFKLHPLLAVDARRRLRVRGRGQSGFRTAAGKATLANKSQASAIDLAQMRGADGRLIPRLRLNFLPRNEGGRRVLVIATSAADAALTGFFSNPEERIRLTARERDVLHGIMRGRRRDQLAHDLDLAVPTVDLHSTNLRRKLGARTVAEAIAIALQMGLV